LRHLFPIFPFVFILTAKTLFGFLQKMKDRHLAKGGYIFVSCLGLLLIINTLRAYPNYVSYFNTLAGGPSNGYRYITDSNADWGQDLKRLALFLNKHPEIDKLRLNYFGMADPKYYLKEKYVSWWDAKKPLEPGWYGISTLFLQESLYDLRKADNQSYRWTKNKKPTYQVGTSILIYHLTQAEATAINNL
jgi:hypothetical protein